MGYPDSRIALNSREMPCSSDKHYLNFNVLLLCTTLNLKANTLTNESI